MLTYVYSLVMLDRNWLFFFLNRRFDLWFNWLIVDGGILLGASGLTGRYWLGSLWYYANPDAAPDVEKCTAGVQLEAGFQEAVWLDNTKVLVGLDTGNAPNRYGNMSGNASNWYRYMSGNAETWYGYMSL